MKRMILFTVLLAAISAAAFGKRVVAKGQTFSPLGSYKIETVDDPVLLKGTDCKAYTISYENTPLVVTVIVSKDKKCKTYVVKSDLLSVKYVCNDMYFGVQRLDKSFEKEGLRTTDDNLDRSAYFHQKILGSGHQVETDAAMLIAAYFPFLLNSNATMLATK